MAATTARSLLSAGTVSRATMPSRSTTTRSARSKTSVSRWEM